MLKGLYPPNSQDEIHEQEVPPPLAQKICKNPNSSALTTLFHVSLPYSLSFEGLTFSGLQGAVLFVSFAFI